MTILRRIQLSSFVKALALLALAFPVVIAIGLLHLDSASKGLAETSALRGAQRENADLLKLQLDEETGLRGYIVTGHKPFLDPYERAQAGFPALLSKLNGDLVPLGLAPELRAEAQELGRIHDSWIAEVASPVLGSGTTAERQSKGKAYIDRFRSLSAAIDRDLNAVANARRDAAQADLKRGVALFGSGIVLVVVAALIITSSQRRLRQDLERERVIVASLQRAFVSGHQAVPAIDLGVAYRSATEGTFVGGDVFDVHRLQDGRALLMVADVSGKGVGAAVETAFVKYAIRALARTTKSPAEIVRQVNQMYAQDGDRWGTGSFIVLFVAILDFEAGEMNFASAGHGSAYMRRGSAVQTLAVTGPALGIVDDSPYGEERLALQAGDTLLVVTDGLTESRDRSGALLTEEGVAAWFSEASESASAQKTVDALLERAFERSSGHIADDLAVVCARVTAAGERSLRRAESVGVPLSLQAEICGNSILPGITPGVAKRKQQT
jgi:serine phosphatase RsbU (regulator of sigma subunit)